MKYASTSPKSRTDLKKVRRTKDVDIVRDGDAPEWTPEMFGRAIARKGLKPVPKKALLSLRIDADVIEWFRAQGAGYQSRMNALLRAYMEAHR
ncbi:MAG: BrnA antitoxin family protein [Gammaproteobacteria bacterium]|nr:BrnA antitoxin family protein [Gammaproteobacteria bacterium]